jgi:hypothetical protein
MPDKMFMKKCPLCKMPYQFGPEVYEGHKLIRYGDLFVCDTCWRGAGRQSGWNPTYEKVLLEYLKAKGLPIPKRNAKGFLPRG